MRYPFDTLSINECYYDNLDKYNHVAVMDIDELIIPRVLDSSFPTLKTLGLKISPLETQMTLNKSIFDHAFQCSHNHMPNIASYVNKLKKRKNLNAKTALYFKMGVYLKHSVVNQILDGLEQALWKSPAFLSQDKKLYFKLPIVLGDKSKSNLTFTVENNKELEYAIYLATVNRLVIKPYLNGKPKHGDNFDRLFYIAIDNIKHTGKTIHNSMSSEYSDLHFGIGNSMVSRVDFDYGHLSHFRNSFWFDEEPISVSDIYFDLNYFACYYLPNLLH